MGRDLAGTLGRRWAGRDRFIIDRAVRCVPDGRSGEGLRCDCGRRMRSFREPAKLHLLLPGGTFTSLAVWDALEFLLNGLVFVLIGLQLPYVLDGIHGQSRLGLLG